MKKNLLKIIIFFGLLCFFNTNVWAQQGELRLKQGTVKIIRGKKINIVNIAGQKFKLRNGDKVQTGSNTNASIFLNVRKEVIQLSSRTFFELDEVSKDQTKIALLTGKGQFKIPKIKGRKKRRKARFKVRTVTAVVGVKGTEFVMGTGNEQTSLLTLTGEVSLAPASDPEIEVIVPQNQASVVVQGSAPTPPITVPPETRANIVSSDSSDSFKKVSFPKPVSIEKARKKKKQEKKKKLEEKKKQEKKKAEKKTEKKKEAKKEEKKAEKKEAKKEEKKEEKKADPKKNEKQAESKDDKDSVKKKEDSPEKNGTTGTDEKKDNNGDPAQSEEKEAVKENTGADENNNEDTDDPPKGELSTEGSTENPETGINAPTDDGVGENDGDEIGLQETDTAEVDEPLLDDAGLDESLSDGNELDDIELEEEPEIDEIYLDEPEIDLDDIISPDILDELDDVTDQINDVVDEVQELDADILIDIQRE